MSLLTSLNAYWKLDEATGNYADSIGSSTLTRNNSVASAAGKLGNCMSLTAASSHYASAADSAALSPTAAMSFQAWVNFTSVANQLCIASKGTFDFGVSATAWSWAIQTPFDGTASEIQIFTPNGADSGSNANALTSGAGFSSGTWLHMFWKFDGSLTGNANRLKFFLNGVQKTLTFSGTVPSALNNDTNELAIGRFTGLNRYFNGKIDEVGLWSRALSDAEITQLYNGGNGLAYPFANSGYFYRRLLAA